MQFPRPIHCNEDEMRAQLKKTPIFEFTERLSEVTRVPTCRPWAHHFGDANASKKLRLPFSHLIFFLFIQTYADVMAQKRVIPAVFSVT